MLTTSWNFRIEPKLIIAQTCVHTRIGRKRISEVLDIEGIRYGIASLKTGR